MSKIDDSVESAIVSALPLEKALEVSSKVEVVFTKLEGKALTPELPTKLKHSGTIHAPAIYAITKHKSNLVDYKNMIVTVDRANMTIHILMDDKDQYSHEIFGRIDLHPDFSKFGINNNKKKYTPSELAEILKMNRHFFKKLADNFEVVSKLKNFDAKVESDIQKHQDSRGNKKELRAQAVTSNIPESFTLSLPIFKGEQASEINIELEVSENLEISLFSYDANQIIETQKNLLIDSQLQRLKDEINKDVLIIEC